MDIKKFNSTEEYLNQVCRLNRTIDNKIADLLQLKELSYGIKAVSLNERVQSSANFDKIGEACARIDEAEKEINDAISEFIETKNHIEKQIESMDKEIHYTILQLRYIKRNRFGKRYSFEEIAIEINNSYRNTTRLHKQALIEFEELYGKEYLK